MRFLVDHVITDSSKNTMLNKYLDCIASMEKAQRILVCLPNSIMLAKVILSAYQHELITIPADPRVPLVHLQFVEQHCEPNCKFFASDDLKINATSVLPSPEHLRFIMYTSGSTGNPKGVMLSKSAVENNAISLAKIHHFKDGHATCLPLFHCNALMMSLLGCFLTDSPLLIQPKFDPYEYFQLIEKYSIRTASMAPAFLHELVISAPKWPNCLEYVISAAAPISQALAIAFYKLYGARLRQGYGLTEATNFSFLMPKLDDRAFYSQYITQYPPVGLPLPDNQVRIVNGEVQIKSVSMMDGYWRNEKATQQTITDDHWLRTGDLGEFRGDYLVLKGRIKEIINRGGETYYPVDVEQAWENTGLKPPFLAVSVENNLLGEDFGLWVGHQDIASLGCLVGCEFKPAAVHFGELRMTSTRKWQRKKMGELLTTYNESKQIYEFLLSKMISLARQLVCYAKKNELILPRKLTNLVDNLFSLKINAKTARQFSEQVRNLNTDIFCNTLFSNKRINSTDWFDLLVFKAPIRTLRPFDIYSRVAIAFVSKFLGRNRLNFCSFLPLISIEKQINQELAGYDAIFLDHLLCYEDDKGEWLRLLYQALAKNQILLIAEPHLDFSVTSSKFTSPFSLLYAFSDKKYPKKLLSRLAWLHLIKKSGFSQYGYSVFRAGSYDFASLFWAIK